jgi:acyl-CoA thioester hydrolase
MAELKRTLESSTRIQYQDCDPFNHLNNSRYIDYMMAARTEQLLDNYGFNTSEIARKEGIGWVSAQTQISYLSPASWMERVAIETRLIRFSESSLVVEALMWNEKKTVLKSILWAKLVHFHIGAQRSHKHSAELLEFFSQVHDPLESIKSFEERVNSLRPILHKA